MAAPPPAGCCCVGSRRPSPFPFALTSAFYRGRKPKGSIMRLTEGSAPRHLAPLRRSLYAAPMSAPLDHIDSWIFDLDNTLYAPSAKLFDLIDARMGAFIMRLLDVDAGEARRVQKQYFHNHGTTMAGLMRHHGVDPEDFLIDVHDIALDRLTVDARPRAGPGGRPRPAPVFSQPDAPF